FPACALKVFEQLSPQLVCSHLFNDAGYYLFTVDVALSCHQSLDQIVNLLSATKAEIETACEAGATC
ncbi:hypothetical protein HK101_004941, partial [Irineochytrium annulatum]